MCKKFRSAPELFPLIELLKVKPSISFPTRRQSPEKHIYLQLQYWDRRLLNSRFKFSRHSFSLLLNAHHHCSGKYLFKRHSSIIEPYPTDLFTIWEPQHQEIGEFYVVQERFATDFEAHKLRKGRSGRSGDLGIFKQDWNFDRGKSRDMLFRDFKIWKCSVGKWR